MGFNVLLIATNANGLTIPRGAKCSVCLQLLDDGVGLSGCHHNCCFKCMKKVADIDSKCPLDGQSFDMRKYFHLNEDIEKWLSYIKLKCPYFDGQVCTATAISIRNASRHRDICPNNPKNKMSSEQINVVKLVHNWMQNNNAMKSVVNNGNGSESCDGLKSKADEESMNSSRRSAQTTSLPKQRGYGFRPTKRTIGPKFFKSEFNPEMDSNWRQ